MGDDFEERSANDAMHEQQTLLLAQLRQQVAQMPKTPRRRPPAAASEAAQELKRRQLVKLLAEIEKRINENARPKKRYISPPCARKPTPSTTTRCAADSFRIDRLSD